MTVVWYNDSVAKTVQAALISSAAKTRIFLQSTKNGNSMVT
jgi:hypothetical protein